MFDIGFQEMLLIMVLALIVFGPSKLPELGKMIGRAMREFKRASDEFRSTVETNLNIAEVESTPTSVPSTPYAEPAAAMPSIMPPPAGAAPALVPEPAPEGSEPSADGGGVATEVAVSGEPYWAQRGSRLFHSRHCAWAERIAGGKRVYFETVAQATSEGHVACPVCEPWQVGFAR